MSDGRDRVLRRSGARSKKASALVKATATAGSKKERKTRVHHWRREGHGRRRLEHLENVPVSFGEFTVKLCARAGKPGTDTCGGSSAPWVHKNGEESQPVGCPSTTKKGRYVAT